MQLGLFLMPTHPPERSLYDGTQWDLQMLRWADEYGYSEAWIGEHFCSPWESIPSPDLMIAQALLQTKRIKLAPGAHLLPFHHPAELAYRVAYLDHLAQGRFMLAVGAGGLPSDWKLFNVDGVSGENRKMMAEALEIMIKIWTSEGEFRYEGKYWTVHPPEPMFGLLRQHIKPFQKPYPPIGVASLSPNSASLKYAGEQGYLPLSLNMSPHYVAGHWDAYAEGAAKGGRTANRADWRLVKEVFVAETDAEAERYVLEGGMGRQQREYMLPLFKQFNYAQYLTADPTTPAEKITPEYLVHNGWLVGSVQTVTDKLVEMYRQLGGFGNLLVLGFDYVENPEPWRRSLELLAKEVIPRFERMIG